MGTWKFDPNTGKPISGAGNNNRANNNNSSAAETKKSGATYSKIKQGEFAGEWCVHAWRKTKNGLMVAKCFPVKKKDEKKLPTYVGKENGHEFKRYTVEVSNASLGTSTTYWSVMRLDTKVIVIKELSLCITPNGSGTTASGKKVKGYFGRNFES